MVQDVVCGMEIDEKKVKWKSEYKGKLYYFCGPMCKLEFDENPQKYASERAQFDVFYGSIHQIEGSRDI